jgi:prevent-host-death family protein
MATTMFVNEVKNDFSGVLSKLADGYEIKVLSDNNLPIAVIMPYPSYEKKQEEVEDLFGFGGILKGLDLPTDKKELRKVYHEHRFA